MPWKEHKENEDVIEVDTMPHHRNITDKLKLIEAQSLSLVVNEMVFKSSEGRMLTHEVIVPQKNVLEPLHIKVFM